MQGVSNPPIISTMNISKPGGTLFKVPREIRDNIYGFTFSDRYIVYGKAFWNYDSIHDEECPSRVPVNLSLLRLSKPIREEALQTLFTRCNFCFAITPMKFSGSDPLFHSKQKVEKLKIPDPLAMDLVKNIMNVDMVFYMAAWDDCERMYPVSDAGMKDMCERSVDAFKGTKTFPECIPRILLKPPSSRL